MAPNVITLTNTEEAEAFSHMEKTITLTNEENMVTLAEDVEFKDEYQFGDLWLKFTTDFYNVSWWSKNSGGASVAFYLPKPPKGYFALGSIAVDNYDSVDNKGNTQWAMCVKEAASNDPSKPPALAKPASWKYLWDDRGTNASLDGSCWLPVPPEGYKALGYVFTRGFQKSSNPENFQDVLDTIRCVREDLVGPAKVGKKVWDTDKSGADNKFVCYEIAPATTFYANPKSPTGLLAPNTLACARKGSTNAQPDDDVIHVLNLPFPYSKDVANKPDKPTLNSLDCPAEFTEPMLDHVMFVPFTAIHDPNCKDQAKLSPFYRLERWVTYQNEIYGYNDSNTEQTYSETIKTGVSKTQSESFSVNTGISVGFEYGVSAGIGIATFEKKVTASFSIEMGYETSNSVSHFQEKETEHTITVAPGEAAVLWAAHYELRVKRKGGAVVPYPLQFSTDEFYVTGYPAHI